MQLLLDPILENITSLTIGTRLYLKYRNIRKTIIEIPLGSFLIQTGTTQRIEIRYNTTLPQKGYVIYTRSGITILEVTTETATTIELTTFDTCEASRLLKDYVSLLHKSTIIGTELIDEVYSNGVLPSYLKNISTDTELVNYVYPLLDNVYTQLVVKELSKLFGLTRHMLPNILYKIDTHNSIVRMYPYKNVYEALYVKSKVYEKGV